jgi:Tfp pilus assembly protein PilV
MIKISQTGDTIVEVLISLTVLAMVLGGAYATSNRALIQSYNAQERLQATKLAEGQLERLKALALKTDSTSLTNYNTLITSPDMCITSSLTVKSHDSSGYECWDNSKLFNFYFSAYNAPTFKVRVEWDSRTSATKNNVEILYRMYHS